MKRLFDVIGSISGFLFILPFFPFIVLAIVVESGFPFLVKLDRISCGRVIKVYKFRSMVRGAHAMKSHLQHLNERERPFFKIKHDPRLTHVGRFLRATRVDEFPQFINVLKGELSLVGPRPHEPNEVARYPLEFQKLGLAQAGLTGLSQVSGASSLPFQRELELDMYYLEHQSLVLDLKILFKTVLIFFTDPTGV